MTGFLFLFLMCVQRKQKNKAQVRWPTTANLPCLGVVALIESINSLSQEDENTFKSSDKEDGLNCNKWRTDVEYTTISRGWIVENCKWAVNLSRKLNSSISSWILPLSPLLFSSKPSPTRITVTHRRFPGSQTGPRREEHRKKLKEELEERLRNLAWKVPLIAFSQSVLIEAADAL